MEKLLWWLKTIPFKKNIYLCIWLCWVLVVAHGIFSCGIWDLVPWPGIKPSSPVLEHSVWASGPPGRSQTIPILKTTSIKHLRLSSTLCKGKGEQFPTYFMRPVEPQYQSDKGNRRKENYRPVILQRCKNSEWIIPN